MPILLSLPNHDQVSELGSLVLEWAKQKGLFSQVYETVDELDTG